MRKEKPILKIHATDRKSGRTWLSVAVLLLIIVLIAGLLLWLLGVLTYGVSSGNLKVGG